MPQKGTRPLQPPPGLVLQMMLPELLRVPAVRRTLVVLAGFALVFPMTRAVAGMGLRGFGEPEPPPRAELVNVPYVPQPAGGTVARDDSAVLVLHDSLFGRSGAVRVRLLELEEARDVPGFARIFGDQALAAPTILGVSTDDDPHAFSFITLRPWREKKGGYVGSYRVGYWPGERSNVSSSYENPTGFIEVVPEIANVRLSEHFRLGDFVTHDQAKVWPKYVVLREALLDKLELVLADLSNQGVRARHVRVLSGFRTPHHNATVGEGAAYASRHQYGDAADLIIDDDRDGRMDDLNNDGRVNYGDTDVILAAVERVERRWPELVGGLGLYASSGPSGPFAHIDVRGSRARWTNAGGGARARARYARRDDGAGSAAVAQKVGGCSASGASAVLCQGLR